MSDAIVSLIRTYVAIWVPAATAWLADRGIDLPVDPATVVVLAVAISCYYTLVRVLEARWPALGALLGAASAPVYPVRAGQARAHRTPG